MESSAIGSPMLRARASLILDPPAEAWFDVDFMHKDIELALGAARELDLPLPTTEAADEALERAQALGYGHRDLAALFQAIEAETAAAGNPVTKHLVVGVTPSEPKGTDT